MGSTGGLQSTAAPLSFEVSLVAQLGDNLATVYVHELVAVSVQEANAQPFLTRAKSRRLKLGVVEDVASKVRLVHLLASEQGKQSLDYLIWDCFPAVLSEG